MPTVHTDNESHKLLIKSQELFSKTYGSAPSKKEILRLAITNYYKLLKGDKHE